MYNVTIQNECIRKLMRRGYVIEEKKGGLDILSVSGKKVVEMTRERERIWVMTKDTYEICRIVDYVSFSDVLNKIVISMDSGNKWMRAE